MKIESLIETMAKLGYLHFEGDSSKGSTVVRFSTIAPHCGKYLEIDFRKRDLRIEYEGPMGLHVHARGLTEDQLAKFIKDTIQPVPLPEAK